MNYFDILFAKGNNSPSPSPTPSGGEPKNVNFYDYEGTLLKSYTTSEWANVTELPANPTHEGLTAQGWNWSKADIDDYISDYPEAIVNVGQMYITDDGATRIYVHFEKGGISPYLNLNVSGGLANIDWGDGSAQQSYVANNTKHTYDNSGDYIIKIIPTSDYTRIQINGSSTSLSYLLNKYTNSNGSSESIPYLNSIKKIEIGSNIIFGIGAFNKCYSLETISIPYGILLNSDSSFRDCYSLRFVVVPNSATNVGNHVFRSCKTLKTVSLPNTLNRLGEYMFAECSLLENITIPDNQITMSASSLYACNSLEEIIIPHSVVNIASNVFTYCYKLKSVRNYSLLITSLDGFMNCYFLSEVNIPENCTEIKSSCFNNDSSLTSIIIPNKVTTLNSCFRYCYGISEYHFLSTTPPTLTSSAVFNEIASDCIIYVPMESVEAYKTATNWSNYASYIQGE